MNGVPMTTGLHFYINMHLRWMKLGFDSNSSTRMNQTIQACFNIKNIIENSTCHSLIRFVNIFNTL